MLFLNDSSNACGRVVNTAYMVMQVAFMMVICVCVCVLSTAPAVWESELLQAGGDSVWSGHLQLCHH